MQGLKVMQYLYTSATIAPIYIIHTQTLCPFNS